MDPSIHLTDRMIPDKIEVTGTLRLDDADKETVRSYVEESGMDLNVALAQIAQNRLGHTGFCVCEVE